MHRSGTADDPGAALCSPCGLDACGACAIPKPGHADAALGSLSEPVGPGVVLYDHATVLKFLQGKLHRTILATVEHILTDLYSTIDFAQDRGARKRIAQDARVRSDVEARFRKDFPTASKLMKG